MHFNPIVMNGRSYPYDLDASIFTKGASGVNFHFYFILRRKQNSPRWENAASRLGLCFSVGP